MVELVRFPNSAPPPSEDKRALACPDCHGLLWRIHTDKMIECQSCAADHDLEELLKAAE